MIFYNFVFIYIGQPEKGNKSEIERMRFTRYPLRKCYCSTRCRIFKPPL